MTLQTRCLAADRPLAGPHREPNTAASTKNEGKEL